MQHATGALQPRYRSTCAVFRLEKFKLRVRAPGSTWACASATCAPLQPAAAKRSGGGGRGAPPQQQQQKDEDIEIFNFETGWNVEAISSVGILGLVRARRPRRGSLPCPSRTPGV